MTSQNLEIHQTGAPKWKSKTILNEWSQQYRLEFSNIFFETVALIRNTNDGESVLH